VVSTSTGGLRPYCPKYDIVTGTTGEAETCETADGVEYTPHSMMHKAIVCMEPTKLEMLDGFERVDAGHKFTPEESNVRVIISGREWSEKRTLIYGSTSSEEAQKHVKTIIERVTAVNHQAELIDGPEITNIAVSGDLGTPLQLETISVELSQQGVDVEYEPEQFPAVIVKLDRPAVTFLLFSTGKFSIQGLRKPSQIEDSIYKIQSLLPIE
jgi:TATA-box binding protein (TBP) (component of TFIID and TFIIIB)